MVCVAYLSARQHIPFVSLLDRAFVKLSYITKANAVSFVRRVAIEASGPSLWRACYVTAAEPYVVVILSVVFKESKECQIYTDSRAV